MAKRVLTIGLDGVPYGLIRDWVAEGELPVMGSLMREGVSGPLKSTIPPTSGPSWSSFMTGMNPAKTGIFDFLRRRAGSYVFPPVNASHRAGRTLWRILSEAGRRVGVLNVPMSYPVEEVNGFMVSGWLTPYMARDYIYPRELGTELREKVGYYRIYPTETFSEGRQEAFFAACRELLDMRLRSALYLMQSREWDFFMVVFFDTDRILHQVWHHLDPTHPWHQKRSTYNEENRNLVLDYFRQVDSAIGRLVEAAGDDVVTLLLSDHGMGPAHRFIILNNWLLEAGVLRLKDALPTRLKAALFRNGFTLVNIHRLADSLRLAKHAEYKGLYSLDRLMKYVFLSFADVDWSRSQAYSYGRHLGSIHLNVRGREPLGIVERGSEYEAVREELIACLSSFTDPDTGEPLVGRIARREEVYSGPYLDRAPDLILWPRLETDIFFGLSEIGSNRVLEPTYRYSGMHRDYGLSVMRGEGIREGAELEGAQIQDMAPTILHLMGLPVPEEMDGQVLRPAFTEGHQAAHPLRISKGPAKTDDGPPGEAPYSEEEEQEIKERLRGLGYMGPG